MDPNANWQEQQKLASELLNHEGPYGDDQQNAAYRLADLVEALNAWLLNGGFPPSAWKR